MLCVAEIIPEINMPPPIETTMRSGAGTLQQFGHDGSLARHDGAIIEGMDIGPAGLARHVHRQRVGTVPGSPVNDDLGTEQANRGELGCGCGFR